MTEATEHRAHRSPLTIVTEVAVLAGVVFFLGHLAYEALKPAPPPPPRAMVGGMNWTSHANNGAAYFSFTNLTTEVRVACTKAVVTATASKVSIESSVVCTGEMKPNTTVHLEASWPKGSPDDICFKESTFGKVLDWSKCELTHQDVAPVFPVTPPTLGAPSAAVSSASATHP